jgi:hypothetical protein
VLTFDLWDQKKADGLLGVFRISFPSFVITFDRKFVIFHLPFTVSFVIFCLFSNFDFFFSFLSSPFYAVDWGLNSGPSP